MPPLSPVPPPQPDSRTRGLGHAAAGQSQLAQGMVSPSSISSGVHTTIPSAHPETGKTGQTFWAIKAALLTGTSLHATHPAVPLSPPSPAVPPSPAQGSNWVPPSRCPVTAGAAPTSARDPAGTPGGPSQGRGAGAGRGDGDWQLLLFGRRFPASLLRFEEGFQESCGFSCHRSILCRGQAGCAQASGLSPPAPPRDAAPRAPHLGGAVEGAGKRLSR